MSYLTMQQEDYECFTAEDFSFLHGIFHKELEVFSHIYLFVRLMDIMF